MPEYQIISLPELNDINLTKQASLVLGTYSVFPTSLRDVKREMMIKQLVN